MRKIIYSAALLALGLTSENLVHAEPFQSLAVPNLPKTHCYIRIDDAHISSKVVKGGHEVVKVNARSTCNYPQEHLTLFVEIWKMGSLGPTLVTWEPASALKYPVSTNHPFKNEKTFKACKGSQVTRYFGIAWSDALVNGRWVVAGPVRSLNAVPLPCGT